MNGLSNQNKMEGNKINENQTVDDEKLWKDLLNLIKWKLLIFCRKGHGKSVWVGFISVIHIFDES